MTRQPPPAAPRTAAAREFMAAVESAVLDPAIAKMIGAKGEAVLALVSPGAIRDALIEAEAAEPAGLDILKLAEAMYLADEPTQWFNTPTHEYQERAARVAAEYARLLRERDDAG